MLRLLKEEADAIQEVLKEHLTEEKLKNQNIYRYVINMFGSSDTCMLELEKNFVPFHRVPVKPFTKEGFFIGECPECFEKVIIQEKGLKRTHGMYCPYCGHLNVYELEKGQTVKHQETMREELTRLYHENLAKGMSKEDAETEAFNVMQNKYEMDGHSI